MYKNINAIEAKEHFDKKTEFLDIREEFENEEIRIPGSKLIPMSELNKRWQEIPQDKEVVVYCRTGNRSAVLLGQLASMGFDKLINMEGGIVEWYKNQFPVETGR
jgi:rhodanese-related sulfurtransferase